MSFAEIEYLCGPKEKNLNTKESEKDLTSDNEPGILRKRKRLRYILGVVAQLEERMSGRHKVAGPTPAFSTGDERCPVSGEGL